MTDLPEGHLYAVVEIPKGSRNKYEWDPQLNAIKLDPRKLLGFKIIATNETAVTLHSPKIGGKQCQVVDATQDAASSASKHSKA